MYIMSITLQNKGSDDIWKSEGREEQQKYYLFRINKVTKAKQTV